MYEYDDFDSSNFESLKWDYREDYDQATTPNVTPGTFVSHRSNGDSNSVPICDLTFGYHWNESSYPAWTGRQPPRKMPTTEYCSSTMHREDSRSNMSPDDMGSSQAPFDITHIASMTRQIQEVFGFQVDAGVSVFELLMSQLDSRASRLDPLSSLHSLHSEYISGTQSNYRKWYFASQMDHFDKQKKQGFVHLSRSTPEVTRTRTNTSSHSQTPHGSTRTSFRQSTNEAEDFEDTEEDTLRSAEFEWNIRFLASSDNSKLVDLLIYLFCWTEANQIRFMPELLAFVVKCARDYYYARFPPFPQHDREFENLEAQYFLNHVITPIYNCYCSFLFVENAAGEWIKREGDHKDFIGYDDMNQLFWYKEGIERLRVSEQYSQKLSNLLNEKHNPKVLRLVNTPGDDWFLALKHVEWHSAFQKTYRESRSWLHNVTNFSRIWILHVSVFWFYTSFNTPSFYTVGYNHMNPTDPEMFVRLTIASFGGLFGPLISIVGVLGESRFVPRNVAGSKSVLPRLLCLIILVALLLGPGIANLMLNPWSSNNEDLMPALVISGILFALSILYTLYFSFQPIQRLFRSSNAAENSATFKNKNRRYLANYLFTANFPERDRSDALVSWLMCVLMFAAKFTESYFFLVLSARDPLRELGILNLEENCGGSWRTIGWILCRWYPFIILIGVILTDLALFFLDTYLWYVILNTLISVIIALNQGTSVWTPWRNIYSQLPQRILSKLLAPTVVSKPNSSRPHALRIIWNSVIENMYRNHILNREQALRLVSVNSITQEPQFFTMEDNGKAIHSGHRIDNAYRRISFFAQSLSTTMQPALSVKEMPMFTVIVPHYKETMILSLSETIKAEVGAKITMLEYLQMLYPVEWENFVSALQPKSYSPFNGASSPCSSWKETVGSNSNSSLDKYPLPPLNSADSIVSSSTGSYCRSQTSHRLATKKLGFSTMDPNDTERTRLWCSERTQTLYRTLRGFHNYSSALRVLNCAEEYSDPQDSPCSTSDKEVRAADDLCERKFRLIAAMQMYTSFSASQLRDLETIMAYVPGLVVCYIEKEKSTGDYYSCLFDSSCPVLDTGRRKPRLRIKLSGNPLLGDGKSDNQNIALPYYRGEYIQLIDANQDNYIEECLKIRNVLMEFDTPTVSAVSVPREDEWWDVEMQEDACSGPSILDPAVAPVAIVGAREYIFSENFGVLGDVAAGKEQTFGTLFSRTLAKVGAKLHYGHPDFLNAIFMTTRGGVSKGQRGLHLNEDIYAGMTAVLRGGRIKHTEYYQCGKGRDLGFVSILNFTTKIGAGMGEQMLSREYFYMGSQLPFDRFIAFYYAHPGFHLNNAFIMLSLEMLLMVVLWTTSVSSMAPVCVIDNKLSPNAARQPVGCKNVMPVLDWVQRCVLSVFSVFFVSLCPLLFQELIEKGLVESIYRIVRHLGSLSMLFEIFVCRIYARSFCEDMKLGGAKYVSTGRTLATSRLPFYRLYSGYHPEVVCGLKAAGILLYASLVIWKMSYLWFWATTFSLCFCPFLFNPHQFNFTDFFLDYRELVRWLLWARPEGESWADFNRRTREKLTGVKDRDSNAQMSRPSFVNSMLNEFGSAVVTTLCLGLPFIYVDTGMRAQYRGQTGNGVLPRIALITLIPVAVNAAFLLALFLFSLLMHICGSKNHGRVISLVPRILSVLGLIFSFWVLYILEERKLGPTLLGFMTTASLHHAIHTLITIAFIRRQESSWKSGDPWWTGNWRSASAGWQIPPLILESYLVKIMESLQFSYDFLICHFIFALQAPILLIPFVDKLHTFFLMWLRPRITAAAAKSVSIKRKRRLLFTSRLYFLVFVLVTGLLCALVTLPMYALPRHEVQVETLLKQLTDW